MNNIQRKGIGKMKIYKKVIACILTLMMFFAQMPVNVFAANQKNNIPLDIVLVLDVSGSMEDPITSTDTTKKLKISEYAASLIEDNDLIYMDAGTTTELIIDFIKNTKANANKLNNMNDL